MDDFTVVNPSDSDTDGDGLGSSEEAFIHGTDLGALALLLVAVARRIRPSDTASAGA